MFSWDASTKPTPERSSMAEQAKALLSGKEAWKPASERDEWEDVGEAVSIGKGGAIGVIERTHRKICFLPNLGPIRVGICDAIVVV